MMAAASWVENELNRYAQMVQPALSAALPDGEPRDYLYDPIKEYPSRAGKMLRPAVLIAATEAYGGDVEQAVEAAVAIELLHNAFLMHDDVEDESELRRGLPTGHELWGIPLAINTGDALALLAVERMSKAAQTLGPFLGPQLMEEFRQMNLRSLEGQALELGWRRDNRVDLDDDDYLRLILLKTCWYTTIFPLRAGALIGSYGTADLAGLVHFGFYLGAAFQIRDDLLNLTGSEVDYGKEILGDLMEGKRTLPLIHVLNAAPGEQRQRIVEFLDGARAQRTVEEAADILAQMRAHGSIEHTIVYARELGTASVPAFEATLGQTPDSRASRFLRSLIPYMLDRAA